MVDDRTSGGPHVLAMDYPNGGSRLTYFDYFVSETGIVGDLRVCILKADGGRLVPDTAFPAAVDGQKPGTGCIGFDRSDWPPNRGLMAGPADNEEWRMTADQEGRALHHPPCGILCSQTSLPHTV